MLSIALSPDSRLLAASNYQVVTVRDVATNKVLLYIPQGISSPIYPVAFSPDGRLLASGDTGGAILIWDPEQCTRVRVLNWRNRPAGHHFWPVKGLAFSPDGRLLASASSDGTV